MFKYANEAQLKKCIHLHTSPTTEIQTLENARYQITYFILLKS